MDAALVTPTVASVERDAGVALEDLHEAGLELFVLRRGMWGLRLPVVPVAAGARSHVVVRGEPHLGLMPSGQVVRCAGTAHPGGHPPGVDSMARGPLPAGREREREG